MYARAWNKAQRGAVLTPLEARIAGVIAEHPEYQAAVANPEAAEADYLPEAGRTNPFLHMGLHIAIREQVAIDRPTGVRAVFSGLAAARGAHAAEHAMLECLAETLWEAQREARPPDDGAYLERLRRLAEPDADLG